MLSESVKLHSLSETVSTNSYLRESITVDPLFKFEIATAVFQTAGRGQRGNKWESEAGKNLMFSILAYPGFIPINQQFILSEAVSLSIIHALRRTMKSADSKELSVKWPNDIYWKNKKLAGILIENDIQGNYLCRSIIGIGLNVNQSTFKSDAPNPISLLNITERITDLDDLLENIVELFLKYFSLLEQGNRDQIHAEYLNNLFRKDEYHRYKDLHGEFTAKINKVEHEGTLILKDTDNTLRRYSFKEVSFIL